jgi:hypothetical protein
MTQIEATIQSQSKPQTSGPKAEDLVDTAKQEQAKTFTQAELDAIIKERLDRQDKKYADYKDLKASAEKLKMLEADKLSAEERAEKKLAGLQKAIEEKEAALAARDLRDKKRMALEGANLDLPEGWTLSEVLDLMPGDEDAIPDQIKVWQKRFPVKKSLGTGTQTSSQGITNLTLDEQIADLTIRMQDSKLSSKEKQALAKQSISLSNRKMRGEK